MNLNAGKEVETEDRGIPKKTPNISMLFTVTPKNVTPNFGKLIYGSGYGATPLFLFRTKSSKNSLADDKRNCDTHI